MGMSSILTVPRRLTFSSFLSTNGHSTAVVLGSYHSFRSRTCSSRIATTSADHRHYTVFQRTHLANFLSRQALDRIYCVVGPQFSLTTENSTTGHMAAVCRISDAVKLLLLIPLPIPCLVSSYDSQWRLHHLPSHDSAQ